MPIRNADDEVVAVAQVINKAGAQEGFSKEDEKVVHVYHTHARTLTCLNGVCLGF